MTPKHQNNVLLDEGSELELCQKGFSVRGSGNFHGLFFMFEGFPQAMGAVLLSSFNVKSSHVIKMLTFLLGWAFN